MELMVNGVVGVNGPMDLDLFIILAVFLGMSAVEPGDVVVIMVLLDNIGFASMPALLGRGAIGRVLLACLFLGLYAG